MKRLIFWCVFFISLTALIGCATGKEQETKRLKGDNINEFTSAEVRAYNADPKNTDKIVCRKEKPLGSIIPKQVCYKKASMENRTRRDQRTIVEIQRKPIAKKR